MEETSDAHGYSKLGKSSRRDNDISVRNGFSNLLPPADTYNVVYLSFVLGGAGFLFPYNRYFWLTYLNVFVVIYCPILL